MSGAFSNCLIALVTPLDEFFSRMLYNAMVGGTVQEELIVSILVSRREKDLMVRSCFFHKIF